MESRPILNRVPEQFLVLSGAGEDGDHVSACRAEDNSYAFLYIPSGKPLSVALNRISGTSIRAWWFNPREGDASLLGLFEPVDSMVFSPPILGRDNDWVLVLDDSSKNYRIPGR